MTNENAASETTVETEENPGLRALELRTNPTKGLEEARNAAAGEAPNAAGGSFSSVVEDEVPSTSSPEATSIPSANTPSPPRQEGNEASED